MIGDDRDGVDGPRLITLRWMIKKPWSDGTRQSSSFSGDLWNARRKSQLESGPRETRESNPSRPHEPTGRRQRRIENGLSSTSRQRHAER